MILKLLVGLAVASQLGSAELLFHPFSLRFKREFFENSGEIIDDENKLVTSGTTNPDSETLETSLPRVKRQDDGSANEAGGDVTYSTAADVIQVTGDVGESTKPLEAESETFSSSNIMTTTRPVIKQNPTTAKAVVATTKRAVVTSKAATVKGATTKTVSTKAGGITTKLAVTTKPNTTKPRGPTTKPVTTRVGATAKPTTTTKRVAAKLGNDATSPTKTTQRIPGSVYFPK